MKRIDGTLYYSLKEVSLFVNRSYQTVLKWFKVSEELRKKGKEGLLPAPTMIGKGHYYSEAQVKFIREKLRKFKRGTFKEFEAKKTTYQKIKEENRILKEKMKELEEGGR